MKKMLRSTSASIIAAFVCTTSPVLASPSGNAAGIAIAPFKDDVFANTRVLQQKGDLTLYDYNEMRDVNGRDRVPGKVALPERVQLLNRADERRLTVDGIETFEAGNPVSAKFAVIFIHGGGGNGTLGFSDVSFGGNFNRLKNLVVQNGGVYESPSMRSFTDISSIQKIFNRINPAAKVIIACGSMGGQTCWKVYGSPKLASRLAGVVLLGAYPHSFNAKEAGVIHRVPVYLAHGTRDPVYNWSTIANEYQWLQQSGLPSKLALYENGRHGTPIRMVNWRDVMSWML